MTGISIGFDDRTLGDDTKLFFGTDRDYAVQYDSANDRLEITDEGAGVDALRIDSAQNVEVPGGRLGVHDTFRVRAPSDPTDTYMDIDVNSVGITTIGRVQNGSAAPAQVNFQDSAGANQGAIIGRSDGLNIETIGSASAIRLHDNTNSLDILVANEGGNIEVPSGQIHVGGSSETRVRSGGITFTGASWNIYSPNLGSSVLNLQDSGNVEIPSGNLMLNGNTLSGAGTIDTNGSGANINVWDATNSQHIALFHEGGNVEVPNGRLQLGDDIEQTVAGELNVITNGSGTDQVVVNDGSASNAAIFRVKEGGNVEIPNGHLTLGGNIYDVPTSINGLDGNNLNINAGNGPGDKLHLHAAGTVGLTVHHTQNVEIPNGQLSVTGQIRPDTAAGIHMPNRGGSSDTQDTIINTALVTGITEIQATDGAGNTTTLT